MPKQIDTDDSLNDYDTKTWRDVADAVWDWKLTFLVVFTFVFVPMGLALALMMGWIQAPTIKWGEAHVVVVATAFTMLGLGSWFIIVPMLKLSSVPVEFVFRVDSEREQILDFWFGSPRMVSKIDVVEGTAYTQSVLGQQCYFVCDLDVDNYTAEGVWRGEYNDVEVETSRQRIKANRGENRKWAKAGHKLYARFPAILDALEFQYSHHKTSKALDKKSVEKDILDDTLRDSVEAIVESVEDVENMDRDEAAQQIAEEAVDGDVDLSDGWQGGDE